MAGVGGAGGPIGIDGIYRNIMSILGIKTNGEVTSLLNSLDVSGQRLAMNQRNRFIIGNNPIPLYPLLDMFKKIQKVSFEGRPIQDIDYPFEIPGSRPINYRYVIGGAYGEIYKSGSNIMKQIIFKLSHQDGRDVINMTQPRDRRRWDINVTMPIQIENEKASRTFFIELIIQIILHSDPDVGRFIPEVYHVYVNQNAAFAHRETRSRNEAPAAAFVAPEVRRRTQVAVRAAEHAAAVEREKFIREADVARLQRAINLTSGNKAYITMENVEYSLDKYCNIISVRNGGRLLELLDIAPIFQQLGQLLEQLNIKYNFRHGDLHTGNIMITATGEIRLIDFGMSCLNFNGLTLKLLNDWSRYDLNSEITNLSTTAGTIAKIGGCDSYDLLIFLTSFIEHLSYKFSPSGRMDLKRLFNFTYNGDHNLYDLLENRFRTRGQGVDPSVDRAVFHLTYPIVLDMLLFPIGPGGTNIKLRTICEMIPHIRSPALFRDKFAAIIAAGAPGTIVAAVRGHLPAAPPRQQGFLRKCFGPICPNWFGGGTRKPKHARRSRQTRRFRGNRRRM